MNRLTIFESIGNELQSIIDTAKSFAWNDRTASQFNDTMKSFAEKHGLRTENDYIFETIYRGRASYEIYIQDKILGNYLQIVMD
jgi:hypothetical protein